MGKNCRTCGWPMEDYEKFCGHCGSEYTPPENPFKEWNLIKKSGQLIIFTIFLIAALFSSLVAFPFGLLTLMFPGAMYYEWWGPGKNMKKCRCCGKRISKEATECPKCGCPRPIY